MIQEFEVEEFSLGNKIASDKIIFKSLKDLESAYKEIDNGRDIYILKDGIITKLLNQMINTKVYEGSIVLGAKKQKGEQVGVE